MKLCIGIYFPWYEIQKKKKNKPGATFTSKRAGDFAWGIMSLKDVHVEKDSKGDNIPWVEK